LYRFIGGTIEVAADRQSKLILGNAGGLRQVHECRVGGGAKLPGDGSSGKMQPVRHRYFDVAAVPGSDWERRRDSSQG
jgi:hypothetical protein